MTCALRFRFPDPARPDGWSTWLYVKARDLICGDEVAPTDATEHIGEAWIADEMAALQRAAAFTAGIQARGRDPGQVDLVLVDLDAEGREVAGTAARIGPVAALPVE
ncbi:hypothetical protein [Cereibacter azotoformans]|uniref:Uncharacterized protein n=1 Tax=Cereibacter azotoformans TaxID=43057 RepID=A0A2T5K707_9RHOB|nr:hypothetical protein [Cereibacter azotoformans]MBO4169529.1 hypothetical protein [Cereibacter azotoformans]PTR18206.1 hypothetical protein C8J28_109166 [Cereibacter azotoformans]